MAHTVKLGLGREGEIRTHDQQFIRLPLLPAELLPKEKGFIRTTLKTGLLIMRHLTVAEGFILIPTRMEGNIYVSPEVPRMAT